MNVYTVCGRISGLTSQWMKRLGWKNIKSIKPGLSNEIIIEMKDQPDAGIRFLEPGQACVVWSVEDFEGRAESRWESFTKDIKDKDGKVLWKAKFPNATKMEDVYDPEEFESALHNMVDNHDAELGITWDTVDIYLDDNCMKTEE